MHVLASSSSAIGHSSALSYQGKNVGFLNTLKNRVFLTVALGNKSDGKTKLHFPRLLLDISR